MLNIAKLKYFLLARFPSLDCSETSRKSLKAECFIKCSSGNMDLCMPQGRQKERFPLCEHEESVENKMRETGLEYRDAPAILISQPPKAIKHESSN